MSWRIVFIALCPGSILSTLLALWASHGFDGFGLDLHDLVALVTAIALTVAIATRSLLGKSLPSRYDQITRA